MKATNSRPKSARRRERAGEGTVVGSRGSGIFGWCSTPAYTISHLKMTETNRQIGHLKMDGVQSQVVCEAFDHGLAFGLFSLDHFANRSGPDIEQQC